MTRDQLVAMFPRREGESIIDWNARVDRESSRINQERIDSANGFVRDPETGQGGYVVPPLDEWIPIRYRSNRIGDSSD